VRPNEWLEVGNWVYKNMPIIGGISFLPYSDHVYKQAPYEEIGLIEYEELVEQTPSEIDWSGLALYESEDNTTSSHEMACVGGSCEIV
jgi:ribonucleoside-diphosphate reductase alpha chain